MRPRFTIDGNNQLEQQLENICSKVQHEFNQIDLSITGVVLGGGYGRGEGGVLQENGNDYPYNDLEFYVFLPTGNRTTCHRFNQQLEPIAHQLTHQLGIEVEFKVLTVNQFNKAGSSMFYYDLVRGFKLIFGTVSELFKNSPHSKEQPLALSEAARLMLNRCSGLLFAKVLLQKPKLSEEDIDFITRNIAKAQLAIGDALLVQHQAYTSSVLKRKTLLTGLIARHIVPNLPNLGSTYLAGVEFKLHPFRKTSPRAELLEKFNQVAQLASEIWLTLEQVRIGHFGTNLTDYALCNNNKCPEQPRWRNLAVNLKTFHRPGLVYPRQHLYNALAILLWDTEQIQKPSMLRFLQTELKTTATDLPNLVFAYQKLWERFR